MCESVREDVKNKLRLGMRLGVKLELEGEEKKGRRWGVGYMRNGCTGEVW